MFAPFLVGFALCISDGNADLPQHLLVDLADRCSQRPDGGRGVEIKDRHEIFVVEVAFRLQSAAGHQSVGDAFSLHFLRVAVFPLFLQKLSEGRKATDKIQPFFLGQPKIPFF